MINRKKLLINNIYKKASTVTEIYKEVTRLNSTKPGDVNFFILVAVEAVIQGIWNGSFHTIEYKFLGEDKVIILDEKWLSKIFRRLLTYTEDSTVLYSDILYCKSIRGFINKDITLDKEKAGSFLQESRKGHYRARRHKAESRNGKIIHYIEPVKLPAYGNRSYKE